jgi:hypothetical protein
MVMFRSAQAAGDSGRAITLNVYGHLFANTHSRAADLM